MNYPFYIVTSPYFGETYAVWNIIKQNSADETDWEPVESFRDPAAAVKRCTELNYVATTLIIVAAGSSRPSSAARSRDRRPSSAEMHSHYCSVCRHSYKHVASKCKNLEHYLCAKHWRKEIAERKKKA